MDLVILSTVLSLVLFELVSGLGVGSLPVTLVKGGLSLIVPSLLDRSSEVQPNAPNLTNAMNLNTSCEILMGWDL